MLFLTTVPFSFALTIHEPSAILCFFDSFVGDLGYAAAAAWLHLAEQVVHLEMLQGEQATLGPYPQAGIA